MSHDTTQSISPAEEQAAQWAARLDGGPLTRTEAQALQTWLDAATSHEALLGEYLHLHGSVRTALPGMDLGRRKPAALLPFPAQWRTWAAVAAVLALFAGWQYFRPQNLSTEAAERQSVTLADGTRAELNARTSLAVRIRGGERHVRLERGEAYFSVAKDPAHPFFVETPAGTVRVTGTVFNVRVDDPTTLVVTVLEGSVTVSPKTGERVTAAPPAADFSLKPLDQLAFDGATAEVRRLGAENVADVVAWREGRVVFDGVPVRVALEYFARYHGREINVAGDVETLRIGGRFKLDDFDGFLRDVEKAVPVRVLRSEGGHVRVVSR